MSNWHIIAQLQWKVYTFYDDHEVPNITKVGMYARNKTDTVCVGANFAPIYYTRMTCKVSGFTLDLGSLDEIPVATAATVWVDLVTGLEYLPIFNQVL